MDTCSSVEMRMCVIAPERLISGERFRSRCPMRLHRAAGGGIVDQAVLAAAPEFRTRKLSVGVGINLAEIADVELA